ncbi:MAG: FecR family protein [Chitinophagaceae bacterium]|nr:MAG: FecR family protein [Chitinophagaceae bacterium]
MQRRLPPKDISLLAEKWLNGTLSPQEQEIFNAWYNQFDDEELSLPPDQHSPLPEIKARMLQQIQQRVKNEEKKPVISLRAKRWVAAAAVAGLLLAGGYVISTFNQPAAEKMVSTDNGQRNKVILPDSSIVWLKPNSSVSYTGFDGKDERRVTLTGEALFEVTKNPLKPFVIQSGEYMVRVLGTSFNVRNNASQPFQLTVLTGKVLVEKTLPDGRKTQQFVDPLQTLTAAGLNELALKAAAPAEKAEVSAGTEYPMDFQNVPFTDIAARIEGKFNVKCKIESEPLLNCRLTANLSGQSLVRTLELIAASINMQFRLKDGEVLLSGSGCE